MANKISTLVVKEQFGACASTAGNMSTFLNAIEEEFVERMESTWSTKLAARTVDGLVTAVNDFITQFKFKISSAILNFVNRVNVMLYEQEQTTITAPEYKTITLISRSWEASNIVFNLPSTPGKLEKFVILVLLKI